MTHSLYDTHLRPLCCSIIPDVHTICSDLLVGVFNEAINDFAYTASEAGLDVTLHAVKEGFSLQVTPH
jgi:hypothetical protein